jgi:hypothetical protein
MLGSEYVSLYNVQVFLDLTPRLGNLKQATTKNKNKNKKKNVIIFPTVL